MPVPSGPVSTDAPGSLAVVGAPPGREETTTPPPASTTTAPAAEASAVRLRRVIRREARVTSSTLNDAAGG